MGLTRKKTQNLRSQRYPSKEATHVKCWSYLKKAFRFPQKHSSGIFIQIQAFCDTSVQSVHLDYCGNVKVRTFCWVCRFFALSLVFELCGYWCFRAKWKKNKSFTCFHPLTLNTLSCSFWQSFKFEWFVLNVNKNTENGAPFKLRASPCFSIYITAPVKSPECKHTSSLSMTSWKKQQLDCTALGLCKPFDQWASVLVPMQKPMAMLLWGLRHRWHGTNYAEKDTALRLRIQSMVLESNVTYMSL